jgi:hypothetical protein
MSSPSSYIEHPACFPIPNPNPKFQTLSTKPYNPDPRPRSHLPVSVERRMSSPSSYIEHPACSFLVGCAESEVCSLHGARMAVPSICGLPFQLDCITNLQPGPRPPTLAPAFRIRDVPGAGSVHPGSSHPVTNLHNFLSFSEALQKGRRGSDAHSMPGQGR